MPSQPQKGGSIVTCDAPSLCISGLLAVPRAGEWKARISLPALRKPAGGVCVALVHVQRGRNQRTVLHEPQGVGFAHVVEPQGDQSLGWTRCSRTNHAREVLLRVPAAESDQVAGRVLLDRIHSGGPSLACNREVEEDLNCFCRS